MGKFKDNKYFKIAIFCIIVVAVCALIVYLIFNLKSLPKTWETFVSILSPFIYGFAIAYFSNPLLNFFELTLFKGKEKPAKWKRVVGIICTFLVITFIILILLAIIIPQLKLSYSELTTNFASYIDSLIATTDKFIKDFPLFNGEYADTYEFLDANEISTDVKDWILKAADFLSLSADNIVKTTLNVVIELKNIIVGIILSIYFLLAKDRLAAQTKKIIASLVSRKTYLNTVQFGRFTNQTVNGFVSGKILDSIIIGILTFILFSIFKIPYTPILSVIIGVTNILPFYGPFIGGIPAAIIVLIAEPSKTLLIIVLILIIQQLDGNVIGPNILGSSTGISALGVLVAITIGGGLFGFIGMFLGVPFYSVFRELYVQHLNRKLIKKYKAKDLDFYYKDPPTKDFNTEAVFINKDVVVDEVIVDYSSVVDDRYLVTSDRNHQKRPKWALAIERFFQWFGRGFVKVCVAIFVPIGRFIARIIYAIIVFFQKVFKKKEVEETNEAKDDIELEEIQAEEITSNEDSNEETSVENETKEDIHTEDLEEAFPNEESKLDESDVDNK